MSIKLHTSLLLAAQQAADEVKREVASIGGSMDEGRKNIRAIEALASKVLPHPRKGTRKDPSSKTRTRFNPGLCRALPCLKTLYCPALSRRVSRI